jgi:flavin-dependent dehydrogenase
MENNLVQYDVAIIGGGLAGLALSIQLAKKNFRVVLFEKEKYPFHKVCGEYISMESWNFLESLGLPLNSFHLPRIDTLILSAPNGKSLTTKLPLGGFGISRYKIDYLLSEIAKENGVFLLEETKVDAVSFNESFTIQYSGPTYPPNREIKALICCGAYGKRSNIDVKWKRDFLTKSNPKTNNYIAVKYHVKTNWPENVIGLHNFKDGYCGISQIEENKYCLCYLTTAATLKRNNNSIAEMQEKVLFQNPALKKIFSESEFLFQQPITISQISFSRKLAVENHVLMLGDAAGMITPLCGNGMSMALHSSKLVASCIEGFLEKNIDRKTMETHYEELWEKEFSARLRIGRILQSFLGAKWISDAFVSTFKTFPFLSQLVIKRTHGQPF